MRNQLNVYPGKALQYPRNLLYQEYHQDTPDRPTKWSLFDGWESATRASFEDLSITKSAYREKSKYKLSLRLVRRLSRLLTPPKDDPYQVCVEYDPADVHIPTRSRSLEGQRRVLSRRQILASLEEEEFSRTMEESDFFEDYSGYPELLDQLTVNPGSSESEWEESPVQDGSQEQKSSTDSFTGERFSRCVLIQSISKEEVRCADSTTSHEQRKLSNSTLGSDINDNCRANCICDNQKISNCDNDGVLAKQKNDYDTDNWVENLGLGDLSWVGTLGVGGFGRVELVTAGENNNTTFALKKLKKIEIKDSKQQQHILNEKDIMLSCSSPFIVKLYRTFRDNRYLYMLMEPCLGGELWTILRDNKRFEDKAARFYTACVIKAFEYLHDKGIVYRDLKPENLLLDSSGYVKLTDFGFAKKLDPGEKSWTFCGTPEYVAPEIITNKSHDHRADIWSVGILMYELLNGIPPFSKKNNSSSQVYTEILKGMKTVRFPTYMSATAVELIRQLCRLSPTQRPSLTVCRKYMWFAGMDWVALENRTMTPPYLPKITGSKDTSNFDNYGTEMQDPDEDFSNWDAHF